MKPTGITRVRNESLIIADTIEHYLTHCDRIFMYDDCSTDDTVHIAAKAGGNRITIVQGEKWITNRVAEETRHRGLLLDLAREAGAEWVYCFDCDERIVGSLPDNPPPECNGYRLRLFDGYMTKQTLEPYESGPLSELKRAWGPEFRSILMLFRVNAAKYVGLDQRSPRIHGNILLADATVKHYGKCLSVEQFEDTCDYYIIYFPKRYQKKWESRKGKAIHTKSDFGRGLFTWRGLMENSDLWVKI